MNETASRSLTEGIDLMLIRRRARLKQYQLAALLGIPGATLSNYETGRTPIPEGFVARVKDVIRQQQEEANG